MVCGMPRTWWFDNRNRRWLRSTSYLENSDGPVNQYLLAWEFNWNKRFFQYYCVRVFFYKHLALPFPPLLIRYMFIWTDFVEIISQQSYRDVWLKITFYSVARQTISTKNAFRLRGKQLVTQHKKFSKTACRFRLSRARSRRKQSDEIISLGRNAVKTTTRTNMATKFYRSRLFVMKWATVSGGSSDDRRTSRNRAVHGSETFVDETACSLFTSTFVAGKNPNESPRSQSISYKS